MIVNINDAKKPGNFLKTLWSSLAFFKENKYSQTNTAAVDRQHLKSEVSELKFSRWSYIINRTCYCPM